MLQRPIPKAQELLPAVGMGTWSTFDVDGSPASRAPLQEVLRIFLAAGGRLMVMRPLEGGGLFGRVRNRPLPAWAAEFDCTSWAQFFLKFILGHPAVTAPSRPRQSQRTCRTTCRPWWAASRMRKPAGR